MPPDRIAVALRDLATTLPEGARLPSVRELMREHAASPVTVQRAIAALGGRGAGHAAARARDVRGRAAGARRAARTWAGRRSRSAAPAPGPAG